MSGTPDNRKSSGNASESVYETLHTKIIGLDIQPGLIVSINDLTEQLKTGRSPVRDALIRLGQEGLITFLPQRGTMISKIDLARVESERFLRFSVEENVMREFMACCTPSDFFGLEESIRAQTQFAEAGDYRAFMDEDDTFHQLFYAATNRKFCADTLWNVSGHYRRVRLLTMTERPVMLTAVREHNEMLTALCARDMSTLQEVFSRHLSRIGQQLRGLVKKHPDLFEKVVVEDKPKDIWTTDFLKTLKREKK